MRRTTPPKRRRSDAPADAAPPYGRRLGRSGALPAVPWPDGKRFAFTIFDDTDWTTMKNGPPVYQVLEDLGFRTTKSVWPIAGAQKPVVGGETCANPEYREWVLGLQQRGFEIALHNVTYHSSTRDEIVHGIEEFRRMFGTYPRVHANHFTNRDNLYWGPSRLSGVHRRVYTILSRGRTRGFDGGSSEGSPHFWGDLCKERTEYVRNFVFTDINTLKACPHMPYHDPERPFVNHWFASSDGHDLTAFLRTLSPSNQDRLEEEGGACVLYTHLGARGFCRDGRVNADVVKTLERLAAKGGWFVPVSTLLDFLRARRDTNVIRFRQRWGLESRWLYEKVFVTRGTT